MIKVFQKGKRIEYTRGDTFLMRIFPKSGKTFPEGSTLEFIIADESTKQNVIDNTYSLSEDGFVVDFSKKDTEIPIGDYVYKMILRTVEGIVITQKSGDFAAIWEA